MGDLYTGSYPVEMGSQTIELPLVEIGEDRAIALLMTIDRGVRLMEVAGKDLADQLRPSAPEVVASAATLGLPVAIEVTRTLGLDDYLILQKSPKFHLGDAIKASVASITSVRPQELLLDRRRVGAVAGRRVAFVDDVVATGSSIAAALELLRGAGAEVVSIGVLLTEGSAWRERLGPDADLVCSLGRIPGFARQGEGWAPVW
jgi:adenine/guanine phosphoribosyltransferase-like PRPP-binding protein